MIDDLLMLTCGWVAGVITTLAIRQAQDDERQPLDPALLPTEVPMPRAWGTPHDGEGVTLTGSSGAKPSAALSGHGAQAPRRRSSS
jgi:hypothetical protein